MAGDLFYWKAPLRDERNLDFVGVFSAPASESAASPNSEFGNQSTASYLINMEPSREKVIRHLEDWKATLGETVEFASIQEKAEHLGLLNSIEVAIKQLRLCDQYGINPGAWFCVFPTEVPGYSQPMFKVVCDNETNDSKSWSEVRFEQRGTVTFHAGDLAIKR